MISRYDNTLAEQQAAPKVVAGEPDGFGSAEHWKEKAQYWAGVAHRLRGETLRGESVDGIVHPPAPQQEAQEPVAIVVECGNLYAKIKLSGEAFGATKVGDELYRAPTAPVPLSEREEIAMVDAAMVEMANIVPPLKRSECARLINAALRAQGENT